MALWQYPGNPRTWPSVLFPSESPQSAVIRAGRQWKETQNREPIQTPPPQSSQHYTCAPTNIDKINVYNISLLIEKLSGLKNGNVNEKQCIRKCKLCISYMHRFTLIILLFIIDGTELDNYTGRIIWKIF